MKSNKPDEKKCQSINLTIQELLSKYNGNFLADKKVIMVRHADSRVLRCLDESNKFVPLKYADTYQMYRNNMNDFERYQNTQSDIRFQSADYMVSFIQASGNLARFIGVYEIGDPISESKTIENNKEVFRYNMKRLQDYEDLRDRIIIDWKSPRNWILFYKNERNINSIGGGYETMPFPGYYKINLSWTDLSKVITNDIWKTALSNQKGVYLITDTSNGKMYVGSAYGEDMILGRWESYVKTLNGGNEGLEELDGEHIKQNFRYSILDIYKSTTDDQIIIDRESYWKDILLTRTFGYNRN